MIDKTTLWIVIILLGLGSFGFRFAFLGIVGDRPLPAWMIRCLRYTAVAILPAMIAPLLVFSNATQTGPDPARLIAGLVTLGVGVLTHNVFAALFSGALALAAGLFVLGG